jgi:2-polyprenyl-3-methyl-5-hydroxy-6-metoxy-1,4-benzoquinol methylase
MSTVCKYTEFVDAPGSTHNRVVDLVPQAARVLEFGCATGYMTEVLKTRRDANVTGVEISPDAARQAGRYADRVIVGDAEALDYEDLLGTELFDAILFADVLEHLRDPATLLTRIRPFLEDEGVLVASIPNVAHGSVRLALLGGEFRYRELGLLDETHLRFFTRESIEDLFEQAGYVVRRWFRQRLDLDQSEISLPVVEPPDGIRAWLEADPDLTTYQFVVEAFRSDAAGQVLAARGAAAERVRRQIDGLQSAVESLQRTADEQSEHLAKLRERSEFLAGRERELQGLLRKAHDELLRRDNEFRELADTEIRERDARLASLEARLEEADAQVREANAVIQMMQSTRIWRIGSSYWRMRGAAKGLLGRG